MECHFAPDISQSLSKHSFEHQSRKFAIRYSNWSGKPDYLKQLGQDSDKLNRVEVKVSQSVHKWTSRPLEVNFDPNEL